MKEVYDVFSAMTFEHIEQIDCDDMQFMANSTVYAFINDNLVTTAYPISLFFVRFVGRS